MTMPQDATLLEMLAACEQLADGYARSLRAVQQLTSAGLEGRGVSAVALHAYHEEAETAATDLERFRVLVARFKQQIRVH
jgi:shikimate kinase